MDRYDKTFVTIISLLLLVVGIIILALPLINKFVNWAITINVNITAIVLIVIGALGLYIVKNK